MKKLKSILSILLCVVAVLWLVPTICVETTISEIKSYELAQSGASEDTYEITYTYERNSQIYEGTYTDQYGKDFVPLIGEQGVCHYLTIAPYPVFNGDAPSPVPPLVLFAVGLLVYICKVPKFLKKKEQTQDELKS